MIIVVPLILESKSTTKPTTKLTKKPKFIIALPNITSNAKLESITNSTTTSIIELANINNNATTKSNKDYNLKSKCKELVKVNK